jgi:hypothetical protein
MPGEMFYNGFLVVPAAPVAQSSMVEIILYTVAAIAYPIILLYFLKGRESKDQGNEGGLSSE